jgi:hypothetical protein
VLTYPLMVGIQMVSADGPRDGVRPGVEHRILSATDPLRDRFVLVIANAINVAADIAAMGSAAARGRRPAITLTVVFGLFSLSAVFLPYQRPVRYLKWLTLALLAYVGVVSRSRFRSAVLLGISGRVADRADAHRDRRRVRDDDQSHLFF